MYHKNLNIKILSLIIIIVLLFLFNLFIGTITIPFEDLLDIIFGNNTDSTNSVIVLNYRLPQAITALFAGAALSVSGLLMQTLFKNPLADPSMLGVSSGAGLGVSIIVLLTGIIGEKALVSFGLWADLSVSIAAFVGASMVLLLLLLFSFKLKNMTSLIIIGLMISYLAGSITDIMKYFSMKEDIHAFVIWGLGSFSAVGSSKIWFFTISISIGLILSILLIKKLNIIILGDTYAENLGLNIKKNNIAIILISGFLTAIVTAYCGPISFLGLAVPHLTRFIFRTSDHRILLPTTMLMGMSVSLLCNIVARIPGFEGNLPINAVTAFIGAPVVIWVILRKRN